MNIPEQQNWVPMFYLRSMILPRHADQVCGEIRATAAWNK